MYGRAPVAAKVSGLAITRSCARCGVCTAPVATAGARLEDAAPRGESAGEPAAPLAAAVVARVGELAACRAALKEAVRAAPWVSAPGTPPPRGDAAAAAAGVPTGGGASSGVGGVASATPGACSDCATSWPAARRSARPSRRGSSSLRCRASCSSCCRSDAAQRTARCPMTRACARTLVSQLWKSAIARCSRAAASSAARSLRKPTSGPSCSPPPPLLGRRISATPAAAVPPAAALPEGWPVLCGVPSRLLAAPPDAAASACGRAAAA